MKHFYAMVDHFFTEKEGLYGNKVFISTIRYWTVTTAILFGSYFYSGDPRLEGGYKSVWDVGRFSIVVISILCLFFRNWSLMREILGHVIFVYAWLAIAVYWFAVDNHDRTFQGDIIRIGASSAAFWMMALMSAVILKEKRKREIKKSYVES